MTTIVEEEDAEQPPSAGIHVFAYQHHHSPRAVRRSRRIVMENAPPTRHASTTLEPANANPKVTIGQALNLPLYIY